MGSELAILVDELGDPVVAAWTSADGDQRWCIIPGQTDWTIVVGWLFHDALPAYVPDALRRARSRHWVDPQLQTTAEQQARQGLADLEAQYAEQKARLEDELRQAQEAADPVRDGLLYGTGSELADAVGQGLSAAGFTVVDLDKDLSATSSADLLVTYQGEAA